MKNIEFGVFLSAEGTKYNEIKKQTISCEKLGYNSVWISDHVLGIYNNPKNSRLECWTTLTALASITKKIKFGQLTICVPFRNPALLAKMSASLDVITKGRLILSIGAGWNKEEFTSYGFSFQNNRNRIIQLTEAAQIIKLLWTQDNPSFSGKYYQIKKAYCIPKPVQKPHPPLMIAGKGEKYTLNTVAKHANLSNFAEWTGTPETYKHKINVLNIHCERVDRNPGEIIKSKSAYVFIDTKHEKAIDKANKYFSMSKSTYLTHGFAGTPEEIIGQIHSYKEIGAELFILYFLGDDWNKEAKLFAEEVIPEYS